MGRRSKGSDTMIFLIGLILGVLYIILRIIEQAILFVKNNQDVVIGFTFLGLAVFSTVKYFLQKKKAEVRAEQLLAEEAAVRNKEIEREKKLRLVESFKKSTDYQLIIGFVIRHGYDNYTSYTSDFKILSEVIEYNSGLDRNSVLMLLADEHKNQVKESFKLKIKKHQPVLYNDYLLAGIESHGDDIESYYINLHELLISEKIIHPDTPAARILSDAIVIRQKRLKESLTRQLSGRGGIDIQAIDQMSPFEFERHIAALYTQKGYKAQTTKLTGDQGADVLLEKLGEKTVVQVKLYSQPVGNKAVQEVCAAIKHYNAHQGIVITNNYFTQSAKSLAISNNIILIDRDQLKYML